MRQNSDIVAGDKYFTLQLYPIQVRHIVSLQVQQRAETILNKYYSISQKQLILICNQLWETSVELSVNWHACQI